MSEAMVEYQEDQVIDEYQEEEVEFPPESVLALTILIGAALTIVSKWPMSFILIAGIPIFCGPFGLGLYMGLFWAVRWPFKQLFDHYRKRNDGTDS